MSTAVTPVPAAGPNAGRLRRRDLRRLLDRFGDGLMYGICALAAVLAGATLVLIGYQIIHGAAPSISRFGLGFVFNTAWQPNPPFEEFGGATLLFGTMVSSLFALLLGAPIAVSIGLFLSLLAPKGISRVISPLVEMLAAIPSVILGFWGILVLAPFVHEHVEPFLHDKLGFIPLFGPPQTTGASVFTASLILTIMVVPIIASISRDLFLSVPKDIQDGASALGATRWEVVRGVVLPSTASGVIAASLLGLGRALGEAIAVTQVIGAGSEIHASLFETGDTLAGRIANQFPGAITQLHQASLFYLGVILLAIGIVSNVGAQWIGRRFDVARKGAAR
jgi:phosphate transport system permease protein